MQKHEIRREFLKLRVKKKSYATCQRLLLERLNYKVSIRTLKRWQNRFEDENWDFMDRSTCPHKVYYKVTLRAEQEILKLRKLTGWGAGKLHQRLQHLGISERTINFVLKKNGLTRKEHNRGQRAKYVRFERKRPNALWHIDDSEFAKEGKIIAIIDDHSRYCLGIYHVQSVTTRVVIELLDELMKGFGIPSQIITDNGSPYGGKSKYSKFDIWCRRRGIIHIRTKVKRPQTNGKVERLFGTIDTEIGFCNHDLEQFRRRYNQDRPHQSLQKKTPAEVYNPKFCW